MQKMLNINDFILYSLLLQKKRKTKNASYTTQTTFPDYE